MFTVRISPQAQALFAQRVADAKLEKPGLVIHRRGSIGDVTRSATGRAEWEIERPHPWIATLDELNAFPAPADLRIFNGVLVSLPALPRAGEENLWVGVRDGDFYVEPIGARRAGTSRQPSRDA